VFLFVQFCDVSIILVIICKQRDFLAYYLPTHTHTLVVENWWKIAPKLFIKKKNWLNVVKFSLQNKKYIKKILRLSQKKKLQKKEKKELVTNYYFKRIFEVTKNHS
jgi:hypothetical protein